jgi:hypothetical protein
VPQKALVEKVLRPIAVLIDIIGFFVEGALVEFTKIPQQILEDNLVAEIRIIQLLKLEYWGFFPRFRIPIAFN